VVRITPTPAITPGIPPIAFIKLSTPFKAVVKKSPNLIKNFSSIKSL